MKEITAQAHSIDDLYSPFDQKPPQARSLEAAQIPQPYRRLLAHNTHMTTTLDKFHRTAVDVVVLERVRRDPFYTRKLVLVNHETRDVVMFGVMLFDFRTASDLVKNQILEEERPLGRILIENTSLRTIHMHSLLEIEPDTELRKVLDLGDGPVEPIYGRIATMYCDGEPAVELLEVVPR